MRKIISILFLSLLLLQAIPVLHFFTVKKSVFYALIDEEKPVEKSGIEKKAGKEFLPASELHLLVKTTSVSFPSFVLRPYSSPTLDKLTPPPNA